MTGPFNSRLEPIAALSLACCCLVVALSPSPVSCGLWVSGIRNLLSPRSSYEKLAEYLHKATSSQELADNTQAARAWLNDDKLTKGASARRLDLARALAGLDDRTPEKLCGRGQLRNLRLVAEHMGRSGLLGPRASSEPAVRRLNHLVVGLVVRARAQCFALLDDHWPRRGRWSPLFASSPDALAYLAQLDTLPHAFILDGYLGRGRLAAANSIYEPEQELDLANRLADLLEAAQARDFARNHHGLRPEAMGGRHTDKRALTQALERYVEAPCREFMAMDEVRQVLEPYVDLLLASFIVSPGVGKLEKFYKLNAGEKPEWPAIEHNSQVLELAYRLRACHVLVRQRGAAQLARLMRRAWREEFADYEED